jgi:DNA-binding NarL/FixJ family response regulator
MTYKAYIVEDNDDIRLILKRMIKRRIREIEFIGESITAEQALEEIPKLKPDLVLVDISLPGIDGIELIRALKPKCDLLCILVVTGHDVERYKQAAIDAGAHDIVSKSEDTTILQCVRELIEKRKGNSCG